MAKSKFSYIYVISDENKNYKVGVSVSPEKRIKQLQTGNQNKLTLVDSFEMPRGKVYSVENKIHKKLQTRYEKHGEWFKDVIEWDLSVIIDEIIEESFKYNK